MEKTGTVVVTSADDGSAVLSAVGDRQVHPLSSNPGLAEGDVLEATLAAEPPLCVTWSIAAEEDRWSVGVEVVDARPSERARDLAADLSEGELRREPVDGGELHVVAVPPARTDAAVSEVAADEATLVRAARLGARRVEVRGADGAISVRYST